jgi:hypothetical protein
MDEKLEEISRNRLKKRARIERAIVFPGIAFILLAMSFGMFWPAFQKTRSPAKILRAKGRISELARAIEYFKKEYGNLPMSTNALATAKDFTLGTIYTGTQASFSSEGAYVANNSEVVGILIAQTNFWNGSPTVNTAHGLNPKKLLCLNPPRDPPSGKDKNGIGIDGVFRDPWGNPYIITFDLNGDGRCDGPIYSVTNATFIIWSFGPDGKANAAQRPDEGDNRDNILSWQ